MSRSLDLLAQLAAREAARSVQERFDALMEAVRRRERATQSYAQQAARVAELEVELLHAKIASRAGGLLEDGARDGDVIGAIESHVEGVLRPNEFGTMLERTLFQLEDEIVERRLMAQAKEMLQRAYSMSEEQAHLHLRMLSRKSRRPQKEVARALIEARSDRGKEFLNG
jgi:AmiR/NasT family two-component response regulator